MHRSLSNVEIEQKRRTINIKHLNYSEQEINCPEIFICFGNTNENIQRAVLDTGAQASLIGLQDLLNLGYSESDIQITRPPQVDFVPPRLLKRQFCLQTVIPKIMNFFFF